MRNGVPRIDWSHPRANGLVGCYLPGITPVNLTGIGGSSTDLIYDTAATLVGTPNGTALSCGASHANAYTTPGALPAQFTSVPLTIFVRMYCPDQQASSAGSVASIDYSTAGGAPYWVMGMVNAGSIAHFTKFNLEWNNAGNWPGAGTATPAFALPSINSYCGTFNYVNGGSNNFARSYLNGQEVIPANAMTGAPSSLAGAGGSALTIGTWLGDRTRYSAVNPDIVCCWNRLFSAADVFIQDADPYGFLIWPDDEVFSAMQNSTVTLSLQGFAPTIMM